MKLQGSRLFSSTRIGFEKAADTPDATVFKSTAKYLVGLRTESEALSRSEADKEAQEWVDAIREVRNSFVGNGQKYQPSKIFAPPGQKEIDLFQKTIDQRASEKFDPTAEQLAEYEQIKDKPIPLRNDPTINYLTNLIMKSGMKARAEKKMSQALYLVHLKTRNDPVALLKNILARMAPLMKLKRYTDGGARAELVPTPLSEKQRNRQAWLWILEAANKRPSKDFSVRLANEILAASEGNSPGFEKRIQQHRLAIVNRSFVKLLTKK